MAKKNQTAPEAEPVLEEEHPDWVDVRAPKGEDTYISVNFRTFILPAGKVSKVPPYIAAEFYRSQEAIDAFEETSEDLKIKPAK